MADREFVSLAPRLASDVVGCPQPVLVQHIRDAAIDACERSLAWRYQITDVLILLFSDRMMYNLYGDMYLDRLLTPQS